MRKMINGFEMAFTDKGHGKTLLFVHGFPLNRELWQPQVNALSQFHRVIAPDLRGHGDSQAIQGPYSMELFTEDLVALLNALRVDGKIVLCGLSMGGYIAFEFYRRYPQRLAGLVLTATRASADSPEAKAGRIQMAKNIQEEGIELVVETMAARLLSPNSLQTQSHLATTVGMMMRRTSLEGVLGDLEAMKTRENSLPTLKEISVPTLVIHGEDDQIVPPEEAAQMAEEIPGARFIAIPHAGHLPNMEQPETFNQALLHFVQGIV